MFSRKLRLQEMATHSWEEHVDSVVSQNCRWVCSNQGKEGRRKEGGEILASLDPSFLLVVVHPSQLLFANSSLIISQQPLVLFSLLPANSQLLPWSPLHCHSRHCTLGRKPCQGNASPSPAMSGQLAVYYFQLD